MHLIRSSGAPGVGTREPARPPPDVARLFQEHAQTVARWAARLGGPSLDVEDAVQEVFLAAHRRLPEFRGEALVTTWLYRATVHVVRHRRRNERWRRFLGGSADEVAGHLAATGPTPLERYERLEATAVVYRILDGMSEKHRNALVLFELEGMSGEQIAALTGARPATVFVWLHRARAEFVRRMKKVAKDMVTP